MRPPRYIASLLVSLGFAGWAAAQVPPGPPPPDGLPFGPSHHGFPPPSGLSTNRTPVSFFRELLALSAEEREKLLASKSEHHRRYLESKLAEYQSLDPAERELRLRTMELRWQLLPLMKLEPEQRAERLANLLPDDRKLVERRLRQWDKLPPELQKDVLQNEMTMSFFVRLESSTPAQKKTMLESMSPEHRRRLDADLDRWNALPAADRDRMLKQFNQVFTLSEKEKARTLQTLAAPARQQVEQTIESFEKLPPDQRRKCMDSFHKFANLPADQQLQFLHNAERWQSMSPGERQVWRDLVNQLPPLPPGLGEPPGPPGLDGPPEPPVFPVVTNK